VRGVTATKRFGKKLSIGCRFALIKSRLKSASPRPVLPGAHKLEQAQLIARAFGEPEPNVGETLPLKKLHRVRERRERRTRTTLQRRLEHVCRTKIPEVGESITEVSDCRMAQS